MFGIENIGVGFDSMDWEFMERINPSASAGISFTGLKSSQEEEYRLRGFLTMNSIASNRTLDVRVNNNSANNYYGAVHNFTNGGTHTTTTYTRGSFEVGYALTGVAGYHYFDVWLPMEFLEWARLWWVQGHSFNTSPFSHVIDGEILYDGGGEITSIQVAPSAGTITGWVDLFKKRRI